MEHTPQLRWAILGTGWIANEMAEAMKRGGRVPAAVGNRTPEKAASFAKTYGIPKAYGSYEEMFTDPDIDVIYIATSHNTHIGFIEKALSHGKHVLCEKAITLNSDELGRAVKLAEERHLVLAEAMTIYHMPLYRTLRERIASGELGRVNLIQLNFGCFKPYDMSNRFFNPALAGGAMLDIGVYALSLARLFLESAPDQVKSFSRMAPTGVDETAGILLTNPQGQLATITMSLHSRLPKRVEISCEKAYIEVTDYPRAEECVIVDAVTKERTTLRAGNTADALLYEVQDLERAVAGQGDMLLPYTVDVMKIMTDLRREWGVSYPEEQK